MNNVSEFDLFDHIIEPCDGIQTPALRWRRCFYHYLRSAEAAVVCSNYFHQLNNHWWFLIALDFFAILDPALYCNNQGR